MVLTALGFTEVSHRTKFSTDCSIVVELSIFVSETSLCLLLSSKFNVHITHHVLANVVSHQHVLDFTVLAQLHKHFFVEVFEVPCCLEQLLLRHLQPICECNGSARVFIELEEQQSLTEWRLVVLACASIAVSARPDLVVERTVDSIQEVIGLRDTYLSSSVPNF